MGNNDNEQEIKQKLKRVFTNGRSLVEDAEILFKAGKLRHAAALAIISVEELSKFFLLIEDHKRTDIFSHRVKFAPVTKFGEKLTSKLSSDEFKTEWKNSIQKMPKASEYDSSQIDDSMERVTAFFEKYFGGMFNLEKMRHRLLNEDVNNTESDPIDYVDFAIKALPLALPHLIEIWTKAEAFFEEEMKN